MKDEDVFLKRCAFYKIKKYKNEKKLMKLINKRFSASSSAYAPRLCANPTKDTMRLNATFSESTFTFVRFTVGGVFVVGGLTTAAVSLIINYLLLQVFKLKYA